MDQKNLALTLTRSERLAFLERGLADVPLTAQTELLTVSRTSLYYQPAAPSAEELALKRRIDEIFTARPFYGSRRICQQLRREGQMVGRKSVQRQMPAAEPFERLARSYLGHRHHVHALAAWLAVPGGGAGLV